MRTKVLLCAAVLAASLASSMAQNVYSLNVVGYVNQTVQAGHWYIWGNPLSSGDNTAGTVLTNMTSVSGNPADWSGSVIWPYVSGGGYGAQDTFVPGLGWLPGNTDLTPGNGFWFYAPTNGTVTFVGQVVTTNTFTMNPGWSIISSAYPLSTNVTTLGLVGGNNDVIYQYHNGYVPSATFVTGLGWLSSGSDVNGPVLGVGEGIWYQNANAKVNWQQVFTIPN